MNNSTFVRRYDLDWLRLIAIVILLFYHTGMLFVPWGWHIKNGETSEAFGYWMAFLHFWRMPLLLFISGAGTYMALGKRTVGEYAGERSNRLLIPLVFGMFVIVPPQIYYERIANYESYIDFYKTVFKFVPYPQGSFSWHHLWFVAYLFLFSMLAIPLLIFLRRRHSEGFKKVLYNILSRPVGILVVPLAMIVATQSLLRPYFPEETHALIDDWAFFTFYFCFFILGSVCYSSPGLWESIGKNRKHLLVAAILILVPFYAFYFHFNDLITLPWTDEQVELLFDVTAVFVSWCWVIAVIAFGQHYLNRPHPWLTKINEGLYPFYILHQTVIIVIGYYVCQLDWSISAKFWTVSLLTLISCVAFYLFLIRPFNLMRVLFGVKRKGQLKPDVLSVAEPKLRG